jgi:hypothetical protein
MFKRLFKQSSSFTHHWIFWYLINQILLCYGIGFARNVAPFFSGSCKTNVMKTASKKSGPKDKDYVNKSEPYEVSYEKKRKTPAKKFATKSKKSA